MGEVDEERQKRMDERFERDRQRLDNLEVTHEELVKITTRLDVIIERQQKQLESHEKRLSEIEAKPARRWDTVVNAVLQWLAVAVLGAIVVFK